MKKKHLHLVVSNKNKSNSYFSTFDKLKDFIDGLMLSRNEKLYIIKDILIKIYRDYERTTGIMDVPYFVKAESMLSQIIQNGKINYYYNRLKKMK